MTNEHHQGQNIYPAPENYPESSFPQPVPVPTVDPDDASTLIAVNYSWQWREPLLAAVDQLLNPATWQGPHDDIILALNRAANLKALLATPVTAGGIDPFEQPPYWDVTQPEEAGNELPSETGFPWYEDVAWTIVDGFLATLVTPTAAIAYTTVIKKLRLFFIYGQHGALFDIQIDGVTVNTVDTYAPTEAVGVVDVIIP